MSTTTVYTRGSRFSEVEILESTELTDAGIAHLIEEVDRRIAPLTWMPYVSEIWTEVGAEIPDKAADLVSEEGWREMIQEIWEAMLVSDGADTFFVSE